VLPDVVDLGLGDVEVARGERAFSAPLLVSHHQGEGHVFVPVGRRAGAQAARAVGFDPPIHETAVAIEPLLLVLPELVEEVLVVHVDGNEHAVANAFGNRGIEGLTHVVIVGSSNAQMAIGTIRGDGVVVPAVVRGHHVCIAVAARVGAPAAFAVLREGKHHAWLARRGTARLASVLGVDTSIAAVCGVDDARVRAGASASGAAAACSRRRDLSGVLAGAKRKCGAADSESNAARSSQGQMVPQGREANPVFHDQGGKSG